MFRNSNQNPYSSFQSYQGRQSLSKTGANFNNSRSPLYPIGPSLTQQQFHPIKRAPSPSPYLSRQGIMPPSYQQKYIRTSNEDVKRQMKSFNYQHRQRQIISRNQNEIQEQQKRRDVLRNSYEREIENVNKNLMRNMDRKQKLLAQIQTLQQTHTELHQQLSALRPPKIQVSTFQPLDRKQQQIIITKNKLLTAIRQKEDDYHKQEQEEEKYWEEQIKLKQKILLKNQEVVKNKRLELHSMKMSIQKPDFLAIQDQVRQQKYQDFLYQAQIIQDKINHIIQSRQKQQRQVFECLSSKKNINHSMLVKHHQLTRQCTTSRIRAEQLQRVSKQMQVANDNLMKQLQRKEKMIQKYELDIHTLKERTLLQQNNLKKMMNDAREKQKTQMEKNISQQMLKVQEDIRYQSSISSRLKNQYQKLYQILCSTASKNIHQTFNATLVV